MRNIFCEFIDFEMPTCLFCQRLVDQNYLLNTIFTIVMFKFIERLQQKWGCCLNIMFLFEKTRRKI